MTGFARSLRVINFHIRAGTSLPLQCGEPRKHVPLNVIKKWAMNSTTLVLIVVTTSLLLGGCRSGRQQTPTITKPQSSPTPSPEPKPQDHPGQSVTGCIEEIPFLKATERSGLLKAWKKVPGYANYRMVEASDFRIPDWVSREYYAGDVERATGWSHDYGELNGTYGLALFTFNRRANYPNCFGLSELLWRRRID